jgi:hypothetical protein
MNMSTDREDMENQFEDLKQKMLRLIDENEKLGEEAEDHRTSRREAEEKLWAAQETVKKHEEEQKKKEEKISSLEQTISELNAAKDNAAAASSMKDGEIDAVKKERDELRTEMDQINAQLEKVSELYREASAEKAKQAEKVDVSDLLAIYIVLIETIFGGKPHARILYTLHDTKAAISRKNLENSTGIMPALVIKAVHDLRNANLVSYNEETQEVKLIKEIL